MVFKIPELTNRDFQTVEEARQFAVISLRIHPVGFAAYVYEGEKCIEEIIKVSSKKYVQFTGKIRGKEVDENGKLIGVYSFANTTHMVSRKPKGPSFYDEMGDL